MGDFASVFVVFLLIEVASLLTTASENDARDRLLSPMVPKLVAVTGDCVVDGSSTLVYKIFKTNYIEVIRVVESATGKETQFQVPRKALDPALLKPGIVVPCTDGTIIVYALDGRETFRQRIPATSIISSIRVSNEEFAILGAWYSDEKKDFELSVKVVRFTGTTMTVRMLGTVPRSGLLVSPDHHSLWWLRDRDSVHFDLTTPN